MKLWVDSRFHRWKCFWTPSGEAKNNNPIEQFNRVIKRDYTMGALMPINTMFEEMLKMARAKAKYQEVVVEHRTPVESMMARHRYLRKGSLIEVKRPQRGGMAFMLSGEASRVQVFQSGVVDRNVRRPTRKTGAAEFFSSTQNLRQNMFETRDQPASGWSVDIERKTCECKIQFTFGFCAHLVAALKALEMQIPGREVAVVFMNRRIRSGGSASESSGGRPRSIGSALSLI
jgi:hypothetical protein